MVWGERGERKQMCVSQWVKTIQNPALHFLDPQGQITVQMECRLVLEENEMTIAVVNESPHHYIVSQLSHLSHHDNRTDPPIRV